MTYALATPVRNERAILPSLLQSVAALRPRPDVWVIVDDFSDDGSYEWILEEATKYDWIHVRRASQKSDEYLGAHVAAVKREGLQVALETAEHKGIELRFLGIVDADLELPVDHYRKLIEHFEREPELGIISSSIASLEEGAPHVERFQRSDQPRGGTQFFRAQCLHDIGGLPPWPAFDSAANVKARSAGWLTRLDPTVVAVQKRATATRFGRKAGFRRKGEYAWFLGTHPLLVLGRSVAYGTSESPSAAWSFLRGWGEGLLFGKPRCPDPDVRRHYGTRRLLEVVQALARRRRGYVSSK